MTNLTTKDTIALYPMYGTQNYRITPDARVWDVVRQAFVLDPWVKCPPADKIVHVKDDLYDTSLTLAQFVAYSFYGKMPTMVNLRYPNDVPTVDNILLEPNLDFYTNMMIVVDGEEFMFFHQNTKTAERYFVSKFGCIAAVEIHCTMPTKVTYKRWTYTNNSYPQISDIGTAVPIHRLVYDAYGKRPRESNEIIHHKDQCRWNPSIDNLEVMSRAEHGVAHNATGRPFKGKESKVLNDEVVHRICKLLEEDVPKDDIITEISGGDVTLRNILACSISNILRGRAYKKISCNYDLSNYSRFQHPINNTEDQLRKMCEMLAPGCKYSDLEISRTTGVNASLVNKVRRGLPIANKFIREIVSEYTIDHRVRTDGRYTPALTEEQAREVRELCEESPLTNIEIALLYGKCADTIRDIRIGRVGSAYGHLFNGPASCKFSEYERKNKSGAALRWIRENADKMTEIKNRNTGK